MENDSANKGMDQGNEVILSLWNEVIIAVNRLLDAHEMFGFKQIEKRLNPSIDEIVFGLKIVEFTLTEMLETNALNFDEIKNALNAKQCVLHIRRIAAALKNKDESEYHGTIRLLQTQPQLC